MFSKLLTLVTGSEVYSYLRSRHKHDPVGIVVANCLVLDEVRVNILNCKRSNIIVSPLNPCLLILISIYCLEGNPYVIAR